jgi:NDP-sugar pyrophosphorylase family protein
MIPLLGKPLLEHAVKPYLPYVSDIIFVISNPLGIKIKEYFKENYLGHNVFYKIQTEQKGTMDAISICKDLINDNELFCVCNGDDLLKESDIKNALENKIIGIGISKKLMPKNYLGIKIKDNYVSGFKIHDTTEDYIEDMFYNGFNILDNKIFGFEPVLLKNGESGLPHTLLANLSTYPLKAFIFQSWGTVNSPRDIADAEDFLQNI